MKIPLGAYLFLGLALARWGVLVLFINTQNDFFMWIYILLVFPIIYIILALIFSKLDKFKLFKRKALDQHDSH